MSAPIAIRMDTPLCQRVPCTDHDWRLHEMWWIDLDQFGRKYAADIVESGRLLGKCLMFHPGFVWDGGSIPDCMWGWFLGDEQTYPCSYLCHDGLYASQWFPRPTCDDLLYFMIKEESALMRCWHRGWWIQRHEIWQKVRLFGWEAWDGHGPDAVSAARLQVELLDLSVMPKDFRQ